MIQVNSDGHLELAFAQLQQDEEAWLLGDQRLHIRFRASNGDTFEARGRLVPDKDVHLLPSSVCPPICLTSLLAKAALAFAYETCLTKKVAELEAENVQLREQLRSIQLASRALTTEKTLPPANPFYPSE